MLKRFAFQSGDAELIADVKRDVDDALVVFNVRAHLVSSTWRVC
jgi:hypothetical protein